MHNTTMLEEGRTCAIDGAQPTNSNNGLIELYESLIATGRVQWTTYQHLERQLGSGGQGVVFLSERRGADGFNQPVAMKFFSPERFATPLAYDKAMLRLARVAARVALIQHDNVLDVQDFVDRNRIRIMVMEWIDGYDLRQLMDPRQLEMVRERSAPKRWEYINSVIATFGPEQSRFKAGVAVAIVRDCLAALAALHREKIVHGDIKPSNIMVKRTGHAKVIDMGSAFELDDLPNQRACTPAYAAPEVLEGSCCTPRSDLASLGYVLIEMLAGRPCFSGDMNLRELLEAKRRLPHQLQDMLPQEVTCNNHLMNLCRRCIAPDPTRRFPSAEAAELLEDGAAQFHRQLVFGDLASEYDHDIRVWLEELRQLDTSSPPNTDPTSL